MISKGNDQFNMWKYSSKKYQVRSTLVYQIDDFGLPNLAIVMFWKTEIFLELDCCSAFQFLCIDSKTISRGWLRTYSFEISRLYEGRHNPKWNQTLKRSERIWIFSKSMCLCRLMSYSLWELDGWFDKFCVDSTPKTDHLCFHFFPFSGPCEVR